MPNGERRIDVKVKALFVALGAVLLAGGPSLAQTEAIQKQVEKKLDQMKKEQAKKDQAGLEELLAAALKANPDIRVAESKLHEAEAELYRARMKVFNRIATLQQDFKHLKAEVDQAAAEYDRVKRSFEQGAVPQATMHQSASALQKAKTELARAEAEMDLLVGKHSAQATEMWRALMGEKAIHFVPDGTIRLWDPQSGKAIKDDELPPTATIQTPMAEKILKALDTPFKAGQPGEVSGRDFIDLLRQHAKGINIQASVNDLDSFKMLQLTQQVPLGAAFQWAEDQFGWRFVIREYGIVAADPSTLPPGAPTLLDFWRKAKAGEQGAP
jgi:hypothetical protein